MCFILKSKAKIFLRNYEGVIIFAFLVHFDGRIRERIRNLL
jgi:hypothetical protein